MAYALVRLRHAPKPKWKLEEALEFLNGPDFVPSTSAPARIEFNGPRHVCALFVPGLMGRVLRWLAPRLEAGRKDNA